MAKDVATTHRQRVRIRTELFGVAERIKCRFCSKWRKIALSFAELGAKEGAWGTAEMITLVEASEKQNGKEIRLTITRHEYPNLFAALEATPPDLRRWAVSSLTQKGWYAAEGGRHAVVYDATAEASRDKRLPPAPPAVLPSIEPYQEELDEMLARCAEERYKAAKADAERGRQQVAAMGDVNAEAKNVSARQRMIEAQARSLGLKFPGTEDNQKRGG